jgi:cysteinyl-tRNA synthetase
VDDKLIVEAGKQNTTVFELAERVTAQYLGALEKLNVTGIDHFPRASEHIGDIIEMCQRLIDRNAAYEANGDVYFDVSADADYGKLSHRKAEDQQSGTRDLAGGEKRNPGDFALWKAAKPDEPDEVKFDSPWGKGRPGWHIECSAMSGKLLGETFDIHGGGMDLIFPHHENEIAQSETCYGKPFARYWMHNGLTRFNTKKISKSDAEMARLMNELVLENLLSKYTGELLRFFVLSTHYRRPIEFSAEEIQAKRKGLESFYRLFERIERVTGQDPYAGGRTSSDLENNASSNAERQVVRMMLDHRQHFLEAMDDDFNTGGAVGVLFEMLPVVNKFMDDHKLDTGGEDSAKRTASAGVQTIRELGALLGIFETKPRQAGAVADEGGLTNELMDLLIRVRAEARKTKQFALADMVRDELGKLNIALEDRPDGTSWRRGT